MTAVWAASRLAPAMLVVGVMTAAFALSHGQHVGLYHDDGIYAASALSLASGGSYRLSNLPQTPGATKYPPLYPMALAGVAAVTPSSVPPLTFARVVSVGALGMLCLVVWHWVRDSGESALATTLLVALLVGFNPGLLSHTDLLLSDVLFALLASVALWLASRPRASASVGSDVLVGAVIALAILTRTIGFTLALAVLSHCAWDRRWKRLFAIAAAIVLALAPYAIWRAAQPDIESALLDYYLSYEPQAWRHLLDAPAATAAIVKTNLAFYARSAGLVLGLPLTWMQIATLAGVVSGAWRLRTSPSGRVIMLAFAWYLVAIAGHPYPMARYLLPLVPMVWMMAARGVPVRWPSSLRMGLLLVPLLATLPWLQLYASLPVDAVHGGFGRSMVYKATGFEEAAEWVRRCTAPEARLASAHDPYYFLATGRKSIRPWVHQPELYTPGYGRYLEVPNPTDTVQRELDAIGVDVLLVDPLLTDGEGEYGRRSLLALATRAEWIRVWQSTDATHQAFMRARDAATRAGCVAGSIAHGY